MGSKSPADLGSDFGDKEPLSDAPERPELCITCQRPSAHTSKAHPVCTCSTPEQLLSQPENISNKKKKKFHKPTSSVSRRQLFSEKMPGIESRPFLFSEEIPSNVSRPLLFSEEVPNQIELVKHVEDSSIPTVLHACHVCKEQFFSSDILSQHLEINHPATSPLPSTSLTPKIIIPKPPIPIPPLPPSTSNQTGKSSLERPFACDNCSKAFSSKFKLMRHVLIHSDQRQYRCTTCDKTFHRKDHLKNHIKVHNPVKRRYKCEKEDCGKEYSSILSFKKHNAVHSVEEGSLDCKICGNLFSSKEDIVTHLKIHSGSRTMKTPADRKYHCERCDRSFFTGKDVRRHMVVHTGRRDFLCQFCPQRFGRKDHLTRHIKKSHNNSSRKNKLKKTSSSFGYSEGKEKSEKSMVDTFATYAQDVECNIDPLSADVKEACETITSSFYKEPKTEETNTGEENMLYILPYDEAAAGPSSAFPTSHFPPFPPDNIKLEESNFSADNSEDLTSLIELMPINEMDTGPTSEFLEQSNEPGTFLNFNTNEIFSLYNMEPDEASSQTTPLPRFSQAFNVTQHAPSEQEHSTDELHLSDPNSN